MIFCCLSHHLPRQKLEKKGYLIYLDGFTRIHGLSSRLTIILLRKFSLRLKTQTIKYACVYIIHVYNNIYIYYNIVLKNKRNILPPSMSQKITGLDPWTGPWRPSSPPQHHLPDVPSPWQCGRCCRPPHARRARSPPLGAKIHGPMGKSKTAFPRFLSRDVTTKDFEGL